MARPSERSRAARRATVLLAGLLTASACSLPQPLSPDEAAARLSVASSLVYAADGSLLANLHGEVNRQSVTLGEVPQHVRDAVVAVEDGRFWSHAGVDPVSLGRALLANVRTAGGAQVQGGSTITQQLVKNLYFPEAGRTIDRKTVEAVLAIGLDARASKDKILEMYLNTVYLGRGAYGVGAAAKAYFGKPITELSVGEGAFLAGIIHSPGRYDLVGVSTPEETGAAIDRGRARRDWAIGRMLRQGALDEAAAGQARDEEFVLRPVARTKWRHPYFVDMLLRRLGVLGATRDSELAPAFDMLGRTVEERTKAVYQGGLRIHTTVDPRVQTAAESAVNEEIAGEPERLSAAVVVIEPSTGAIRAVVGGRDYYPDGCVDGAPDQPPACGRAKVNIALGVGGGGSGRQPGSGFKAFVLARAMQDGLTLGDRFSSSPFTHDLPSGPWKVQNYEGDGGGTMNLLDATRKSVNAAFARLEIEGLGGGDALEGARKVAELARGVGFAFETPDEVRARCGDRYGKSPSCTPADAVPAIALGATEVAPIEMASAYGVFANDGVRVEPAAVTRIEDANGRVLFEAHSQPRRVVDERVARAVTHALRQVVESGTATRAALDDKRAAAGKTGTSQQWRDAWFTGYVPQLVASVWVGNPSLVTTRGRATIESMTPRNGYSRRITGGSYPAAIWKRVMTTALEGVPPADFAPAPDGLMKPSRTPPPDDHPEEPGEVVAEHGDAVAAGGVPSVVGRPLAAAVAAVQRAGYWAQIVRACGPGHSIHVWRQSPGGGTRAHRGAHVTLWYSPAGHC